MFSILLSIDTIRLDSSKQDGGVYLSDMSQSIGQKREVEIINPDDSQTIKRLKTSTNSGSVARSDKYGSPKYVVELINDWYLVITSRGDKFFHNKSTNISKWVLDENKDTDVIDYIYDNEDGESDLDGDSTSDSPIRTKIDQFLILIAKARGYVINSDEKESEGEEEKDEFEETTNEIEDIKTTPTQNEPCLEVKTEPATTASSEDNRNSLNLGYGSSDDSDDSDDDNNDEEKEKDVPKNASSDILMKTEIRKDVISDESRLVNLRAEAEQKHKVEDEHEHEAEYEYEDQKSISTAEDDEEDEYGLQLSDLENDEENNYSNDNNSDNDDEEEEKDGEEEEDGAIDNDMISELKNEINNMNPNNNLSDTQIKSYFKLFNESKLDPFSSWDLENENVMYSTKYLDIDDDSLRRLVFDSWCKIKTAAINETEDLYHDTDESVQISHPEPLSQDQDVISNQVSVFVNFLEEYSKTSKLLRFFIEFKRKLKKNEVFQNLELYKSSNFSEMENVYKNYYKFTKLQQQQQGENKIEIEEFILDSLESNKNLKKLNCDSPINYNLLTELINTSEINSIKSLIHKIAHENIDEILEELYHEVTLVTFNSDDESTKRLKLISILKYFVNQNEKKK